MLHTNACVFPYLSYLLCLMQFSHLHPDDQSNEMFTYEGGFVDGDVAGEFRPQQQVGIEGSGRDLPSGIFVAGAAGVDSTANMAPSTHTGLKPSAKVQAAAGDNGLGKNSWDASSSSFILDGIVIGRSSDAGDTLQL